MCRSQGRLRWGAGGTAAPPALSKDLIILVQKCLKCALNRNLAPLPLVRAGAPGRSFSVDSQHDCTIYCLRNAVFASYTYYFISLLFSVSKEYFPNVLSSTFLLLSHTSLKVTISIVILSLTI